MNELIWCVPHFLHYDAHYDLWPITEIEKNRVLYKLEANGVTGFCTISAFTVRGVPAVRVTWDDGSTNTFVLGAAVLDYTGGAVWK